MLDTELPYGVFSSLSSNFLAVMLRLLLAAAMRRSLL